MGEGDKSKSEGVKPVQGGGLVFLKPSAVSGGARGGKLNLQRRSVADCDSMESKPVR
jgi:hypothetical protein